MDSGLFLFKNVYKTRAYNENEKAITIKVNITLGAVTIIEIVFKSSHSWVSGFHVGF